MSEVSNGKVIYEGGSGELEEKNRGLLQILHQLPQKRMR